VTEGLNIGGSAETAVAEAYQSNDMTGVTAAAASWTSSFTPTKYVSTAVVSDLGVITITFSAATPQISGKTLTLSPFIQGAVLATNQQGNIDWACSSATHTTATAQSMTPANAGTIDPRYVPTICK
jgi:type IV pilus assembly protein PilA